MLSTTACFAYELKIIYLNEDYIYNGKGTIEVKDGVLNVSLAGKTDFARAGMMPVFSVLDNRLLVLSDKSDKIKQSY